MLSCLHSTYSWLHQIFSLVLDIDSLLNGLIETVRKRVIVLGFLNKPERFIAIADMLVLPSYREGFGTVVIEAAAMGS